MLKDWQGSLKGSLEGLEVSTFENVLTAQIVVDGKVLPGRKLNQLA
jgi:hypothetical protein